MMHPSYATATGKMRLEIGEAAAVLRLDVLKGAFVSDSNTVPMSAWKTGSGAQVIFEDMR